MDLDSEDDGEIEEEAGSDAAKVGFLLNSFATCLCRCWPEPTGAIHFVKSKSFSLSFRT